MTRLVRWARRPTGIPGLGATAMPTGIRLLSRHDVKVETRVWTLPRTVFSLWIPHRGLPLSWSQLSHEGLTAPGR